MSLIDLPADIRRELLKRLDAKDLSNRCMTDRTSAEFCSEPYFWQQKVLELPRRELENDWFTELALLGETRLLSRLMDASAQSA